MTTSLSTLQVRYEHDVVMARQRARQIGGLLGLDPLEQTRVSTSVSEIARNAFAYGGGGRVEYLVDLETAPQLLLIRVTDSGPGIANVAEILAGSYRSRTGMGLGLVGARRLMDHFQLDTAPGSGTTVVMGKKLPVAKRLTGRDVSALAEALVRAEPQNPYEELQHQNQELLSTLQELRERQEELTRLNEELGDTNRGVIALYAEMEEQADLLRRADGLKTRFLSNMSHEFRTPLNSILALSRLLLDRMDGDLTPEQEKQCSYIRHAAEDLSELVNDLLDLAKVEAGKIVIEAAEFDVGDMFSALRGMLRPLLSEDRVALVFEHPQPPLIMYSDESKISQILRNFISNAIKFTREGEVRVWAELHEPHGRVALCVSDTGIGIAPDQLGTIFEEFAQLASPLQKTAKGTGLGLPLCRRLAGLLGGTVGVVSEPGVGSTFTALLPLRYAGGTEQELFPELIPRIDPTRSTVLVVEDDHEMTLIYEKYLKGSGFQVVPAPTVRHARKALAERRPAAIVLDILFPGGDAWAFLAELKSDPATRDIPLVVISVLDSEQRGRVLGADDYAAKPVERSWLLTRLKELVPNGAEGDVLIIDDDEISRYIMKGMLADTKYGVMEAESGDEGLRLAREHRPRVVLLDLVMPGMDGFQVLQELRADPQLEGLKIIVVTSKTLEPDELRYLEEAAEAVVGKDSHSREETISQVREALRRVEVGGRAEVAEG